MIKFKKGTIAIWASFSNKPIDEWLKYTVGVEKSKGKSQIEKEIGYIDVDFFGYYSTENNEIISIDDLIAEADTQSLETDKEIIEQSKRLGINSGNRLYYYCNYEFLPDGIDKLYNDLTFIGNFED